MIAYSVRQRTQEIGIRIALGAQKHQVLRMVVGKGTALAGFGIVLGLAGSVWLTRFMTALLYGVSPNDPTTLLAVSVSLLAAAILASYVPAIRAARVDPAGTLRSDLS